MQFIFLVNIKNTSIYKQTDSDELKGQIRKRKEYQFVFGKQLVKNKEDDM